MCVKSVSLNNLFTNFPQYYFFIVTSTPGQAVGQLVETLRYKPKDRGFDFRGVIRIFR
jgi:hypothetical protein